MTLRKIVVCSGILNQCLHGINRGLICVQITRNHSSISFVITHFLEGVSGVKLVLLLGVSFDTLASGVRNVYESAIVLGTV